MILPEASPPPEVTLSFLGGQLSSGDFVMVSGPGRPLLSPRGERSPWSPALCARFWDLARWPGTWTLFTVSAECPAGSPHRNAGFRRFHSSGGPCWPWGSPQRVVAVTQSCHRGSAGHGPQAEPWVPQSQEGSRLHLEVTRETKEMAFGQGAGPAAPHCPQPWCHATPKSHVMGGCQMLPE